MAGKLYNLARMTTATTGTGTITLGSAASGFLSFAAAGIADGDVISYAIKDGSNSEIGTGTYTASGTTLSRTVTKSTNSNTAISLSGSAVVFITPRAEDFYLPGIPQGRLTLSTGVKVMTSTVSGATTVYYTPGLVPLYNGSSWAMADILAELSQTTTDTTKSPAACTTNSNYDMFVWDDGGTFRCTRGPAWTSDTARGTGAGTTELQDVNGIPTNKNAITNGPAANRGTYVGTIRTNGSSTVDWTLGTIAAGGGAARLCVWNAYNRVEVSTQVSDSTDSWTLASAGPTWRAANNSATNRVSYVCGLPEDAFRGAYNCLAFGGTTAGAAVGIGYDSTTAFSGQTAYTAANSANVLMTICARYDTTSLGFHYMSGIEINGAASQTATFYGDVGVPSFIQSGLLFSGKM